MSRADAIAIIECATSTVAWPAERQAPFPRHCSLARIALKTDFVVIGCGPVGAMLANLLGLPRISTLVLEREAEILQASCGAF
jgi:threonine dehydrogenase-like Zn-dependent dehydrogenase